MARIGYLLFLPFLPGCVAFGYPSVTYTPKLNIAEPDVRVFKSTTSTGGMNIVMTGGGWRGGRIEEIPIDHGSVETQSDAYFAYLVGGFPVCFSEFRHFAILLYRPGYEIIEIPSQWWGLMLLHGECARFDWKPAASTQVQVETLEKLCPPNDSNLPTESVRRFVAGEYERIALTVGTSSPDESARLHSRAKRLRDFPSKIMPAATNTITSPPPPPCFADTPRCPGAPQRLH